MGHKEHTMYIQSTGTKASLRGHAITRARMSTKLLRREEAYSAAVPAVVITYPVCPSDKSKYQAFCRERMLVGISTPRGGDG